jgi:transposase
MIERPADCEIRSVIRFLNARNVKPADIHRQICEVYGENAMSDGMVRKWVRKFKEGRDNVHDEPRSGRPSVITGGHVLRVGDKETGARL